MPTDLSVRRLTLRTMYYDCTNIGCTLYELLCTLFKSETYAYTIVSYEIHLDYFFHETCRGHRTVTKNKCSDFYCC